MMNIMHFYEAGKARSGTALVPIFDTVKMTLTISTRSGNSVLNKGDGSPLTNISNVKLRDYTDGAHICIFRYYYANPFTGNVSIKFLRGLKDVYSIDLTEFQQDTTTAKFNITDIEAFFAQFPNLFSLRFSEYAYQTTARMSIIKGDFAKLPNSVERVLIENTEVIPALNANQQLLVNFSSYDAASKLKFFRYTGGINWIGVSLKIIGDLSKLPTSCNHLYLIKSSSQSAITYTAGKVWASSFDTLSIPLVLTTAELDNLLIDMDNSITTKIGAGVIYLLGLRSAASDSAVASLQAKGFTVNVSRGYQILILPFQNSFSDSGEIGMTMVAGGTSNQPTFALSGRKAGEYCAVFNGSQSIKTTANLPINSDKVTVAFWMKTSQTTLGMITELSTHASSNNAFYATLNETATGISSIDSASNGINAKSAAFAINNGNWHHVVVVIDRNQSATNTIKIYINDSLKSTTVMYGLNVNTVGNFLNDILYIGQRAGSAFGFNGSLTRLKIYNYPFTATEVTNLYNSEL